VNLEKLEAVKLAELIKATPPKCPICGKSMESIGKDKGYRCRKCGTRRASPVYEKVRRDLETGLYEVPPSARRHLAKQIIRIKEPGCLMHPSR
jgi:tRNA(Ile2)-agmatinylcytidine synthase